MFFFSVCSAPPAADPVDKLRRFSSPQRMLEHCTGPWGSNVDRHDTRRWIRVKYIVRCALLPLCLGVDTTDALTLTPTGFAPWVLYRSVPESEHPPIIHYPPPESIHPSIHPSSSSLIDVPCTKYLLLGPLLHPRWANQQQPPSPLPRVGPFHRLPQTER